MTYFCISIISKWCSQRSNTQRVLARWNIIPFLTGNMSIYSQNIIQIIKIFNLLIAVRKQIHIYYLETKQLTDMYTKKKPTQTFQTYKTSRIVAFIPNTHFFSSPSNGNTATFLNVGSQKCFFAAILRRSLKLPWKLR